MIPTLQPGTLVIFQRKRMPRVGDIVIVRHDGLEKVKRVEKLQAARIYLLGDNPDDSVDSRTFGWVEIGAVRGRLIWPRARQHRS